MMCFYCNAVFKTSTRTNAVLTYIKNLRHGAISEYRCINILSNPCLNRVHDAISFPFSWKGQAQRDSAAPASAEGVPGLFSAEGS